MTADAALPAAPAARQSAWRARFLAALATVALALWLHAPVRQVADPTLDTSNYASFAHFTAQGLQFGTDVLHVGGPYGFVHYGFVHGGSLFWKRLPLELLVKLVLGGLIVWFFRRAAGGWVRWAWLAVLLLFAPHVEDLPYDLAILLAGLALIDLHHRPGRPALLLGLGLSAFLALLSLIKGTQAVLSLATFGLLLLQAAATRDFRRLPALAAAYAGALVVLLLVAGQNPLNFPAYLVSIYQQSAGYNGAMALDEPRAAFLSGLGALLALEAMLFVLLLRGWRSPALLTGAALLAGLTFVEWKHGFVRADGHVYIFYHYASIAALMILLLARGAEPAPGRAARWTLATLAALAFGLGVWADGPQAMYRHRHLLFATPDHLAASAREIFSPGPTKRRLDAELAAARRHYALPLVRELVGSARVDFFGTEHGYLTLNRLDYRPRPMGGGNFSVFNGWLHDVNVRHLADPAKRPEFFLTRVEMFDHRLLAQEDAGTLRVLLAAYAPVAAEQGLVLYRRRGETVPPAPRLLGSQPADFDTPIPVPAVGPGEMLAFECDLPLNWVGRLRAVAYKSPLAFISLEGTGVTHPSRRLIPALAARPVLLNPLLEDNADLLEVYAGGPAKSVRSFRLHTPRPGLFDRARVAVRFYAIPRPAPVPAETLAEVRARLAFPAANRTPEEFQPPQAPLRRFDGLLVQMLEPPGRLRFALTDSDNEVSFLHGLDPESYLEGATDGVEFIVELERPGQPAQGLYHRWLRPRLQPADRGIHASTLILPPFPRGSSLVLRTGAGVDGDGAWDWGWFSRIRLVGQGYRTEQFPGFGRLPVAVEAAICGALTEGDRTIFMLNAPGALEFALDGRERTLEFSGGLLPGAYSAGGESDGVTFAVEVTEPGRPPRPLFSRHLQPREQEADRGSVRFTVPLPALAPGSRLRVATSPGPAGNGAWDWAYLDSLRFE